MDDEKEQCRKPTGELGKKVLEGMNSHHVPLWGEAISRLPEKADRVLDIGCGGGGFLKRIRGRYPGAELNGIDISEDALHLTAETNAGDEHLCLQVASVESIPFEDGTFDVVTAMETYFFWPDEEQGLREAARVLAPGGTLAVASEVGLGGDDEEEVLRICDEYRMTLLTDEEMIRILSDAGLDAEAFRTEHGRVYIGKRPMRERGDGSRVRGIRIRRHGSGDSEFKRRSINDFRGCCTYFEPDSGRFPHAKCKTRCFPEILVSSGVLRADPMGRIRRHSAHFFSIPTISTA